MWNKEALLQLAQTKKFAIAASSVVAGASGAVGGYFFAKKRLKKQFEEELDKEIQASRVFFSQLNKTGEYADLNAMAEKYETPEEPEEEVVDEDVATAAEILLEQKYMAYDKVKKIKETTVTDEDVKVKASIKKNIFDSASSSGPDFNSDAELEKKEKGAPYILEAKEFFENESGYTQQQLTYFEGDAVLMYDDDDQHIPHPIPVIGTDTLRFGYGSNDENVVYVRNDKLRKEFEITRSAGKYSEEIAGFDELEHSDRPKIRKFRVE